MVKMRPPMPDVGNQTEPNEASIEHNLILGCTSNITFWSVRLF